MGGSHAQWSSFRGSKAYVSCLKPGRSLLGLSHLCGECFGGALVLSMWRHSWQKSISTHGFRDSVFSTWLHDCGPVMTESTVAVGERRRGSCLLYGNKEQNRKNRKQRRICSRQDKIGLPRTHPLCPASFSEASPPELFSISQHGSTSWGPPIYSMCELGWNMSSVRYIHGPVRCPQD